MSRDRDPGYSDPIPGTTPAELSRIADSLAELIALLRPLVETVTAQPEPLTLRSPAFMPCLAGDPGSNGFRRCMEPYGHDGDHRHRDGLNAGVEHVWTQRHGDVPPPADQTVQEVPCGHFGPVTDRGIHPRPQCKLSRGHTGRHNDGHGVWGVNR